MTHSRRLAPAIVVAALLGTTIAALPVVAQEPAVLDASELEKLCRENAPNKKRRATCLDIVQKVLAPDGSIVLPAVEPPSGPVEGAGVGTAQATDHLAITLTEFIWDATAGFSPDDGFQWVAAGFEVESLDPDAYLAVPNFTATDTAGFSYRFSTAVDPNLENGNLFDGQKRQGYVTFQVPEDAQSLSIDYVPFVSDSDEPLTWAVSNG